MSKSYKEMMNNVKAFVLDIDGVLTDSSILVTTSGEMLRTMSIRDGYAIRDAAKKGYPVGIISGGTNDGVRIRLENLGVTYIKLGVDDKITALNDFFSAHGLSAGEVLYMGDDLPDYHAMKLVGLPACPQDAAPEIKGISVYVSHKNGGHGAVRDVIEQVLKVQGKWMDSFDAKFD
jgi:3-deoxy-D-manno-octulosonate 8-phosphate phosphatase (KDO 8-P phosphatase)